MEKSGHVLTRAGGGDTAVGTQGEELTLGLSTSLVFLNSLYSVDMPPA